MRTGICSCGADIEEVIDTPPAAGKFWQRVGTCEVCVDNHWHEPREPVEKYFDNPAKAPESSPEMVYGVGSMDGQIMIQGQIMDTPRPAVPAQVAPQEPAIKSVRHIPGTIHGTNYGPPPAAQPVSAPSPEIPPTGCPRCSIGTPIFGDHCIVCVHVPDAIAALIKEIQAKRAVAESALRAARAELAAMTEDRDLWRYDHEGDCPVQAALEAERASRKQEAVERDRNLHFFENEQRNHESSIIGWKQVEDALRRLLDRRPPTISCENWHHAKKDRHDGFTPCPVQARWDDAVKTADAALSKPVPVPAERERGK
jgi:hypothetical protein